MSARFEQWTRAKLGEYVERDGETWVTVTVPVDSVRHDPRADVITLLMPPRLPSASGSYHFEAPSHAALREGAAAERALVFDHALAQESDATSAHSATVPTAPKRKRGKR
jgi:hypothetical protein